ncbi:demethoxyubiquinone hydroxylase family protein [bacterium]|nr:demethoxyubiquinone hydroxylase family protein [bacterium]
MLDPLIIGIDRALRTLFVIPSSSRAVPGRECVEPSMSAEEQRHAGALMRVNHVGEICAQALYQGQALTCSAPEIRKALENAADEETEHLAWTERRIKELPIQDIKSRMIVQQMKLDEVSHAEMAVRLGARALLSQVKTAMRLAAGAMTRTAYYI